MSALNELSSLLPLDDDEVNAWIDETVQRGNEREFLFLCLAMINAERRLEARHLAGGATMIEAPNALGFIAWHCQGDVAHCLFEAVKTRPLTWEREAGALYLICAWCQEFRKGELPADFVAHVRILARVRSLTRIGLLYLHALATRVRDGALRQILLSRRDHVEERAVRLFDQEMLLAAKGPLAGLFPRERQKDAVAGFTVRRLVARIGRNEPCPCGTGKKYKNCCLEKDQDRWRKSSFVPGKTWSEVRAELERHLTRPILENLPPHQLALLDAAKLPEPLIKPFLHRIIALQFVEESMTALEKLGYREDLHFYSKMVELSAVRAKRRDILERLLRWYPNEEKAKSDLCTGARLLLAEPDPAAVLELMEGSAREILQIEDTGMIYQFAYGFLESKWPALAICIARSFIPLLKPDEASVTFEKLLQTRDLLNLSPDDPVGEILDHHLLQEKQASGKQAQALKLAQARLEAKSNEVNGLKDTLHRLQRELKKHEKPSSAPAANCDVPSSPAQKSEHADERTQQLRRKLENLKAELKARHLERNALRRELQEVHVELEALREKSNGEKHAQDAVVDHEQELMLPEETHENHPVRLIEFPVHFEQRLVSVPKSVARGVLVALGKLAAGDSAAFHGVVRLKACPSVYRQRVGIDFRLLFRLLPGTVQVVDLIPRQDLERKIKTLAAQF